jgi:hypothetical protein
MKHYLQTRRLAEERVELLVLRVDARHGLNIHREDALFVVDPPEARGAGRRPVGANRICEFCKSYL